MLFILDFGKALPCSAPFKASPSEFVIRKVSNWEAIMCCHVGHRDTGFSQVGLFWNLLKPAHLITLLPAYSLSAAASHCSHSSRPPSSPWPQALMVTTADCSAAAHITPALALHAAWMLSSFHLGQHYSPFCSQLSLTWRGNSSLIQLVLTASYVQVIMLTTGIQRGIRQKSPCLMYGGDAHGVHVPVREKES